MADNIPATTLATGSDHVDLESSWVERFAVLGGLAYVFWYALRRKSSDTLGGATYSREKYLARAAYLRSLPEDHPERVAERERVRQASARRRAAEKARAAADPQYAAKRKAAKATINKKSREKNLEATRAQEAAYMRERRARLKNDETFKQRRRGEAKRSYYASRARVLQALKTGDTSKLVTKQDLRLFAQARGDTAQAYTPAVAAARQRAVKKRYAKLREQAAARREAEERWESMRGPLAREADKLLENDPVWQAMQRRQPEETSRAFDLRDREPEAQKLVLDPEDYELLLTGRKGGDVEDLFTATARQALVPQKTRLVRGNKKLLEQAFKSKFWRPK